MSGRPIRLVAAAVGSALAAVLAASAAQAGCYTCGYAPTYVAPVTYAAPCGGCTTTVVRRVVYAEPRFVYAAPCGGCGTTYGSPVYPVDLGPTYTTPVAMPEDDDDYVASRSYRYASRYDDLDDYRSRTYRYRALRARLYDAHLHRAARFSVTHSHVPVSYRPLHRDAQPHKLRLHD
jgi:hypothetical protein